MTIAVNPYPYLKAFAWISIVALTCSIFSSFWLPMLIGAVTVTLILMLVPKRG